VLQPDATVLHGGASAWLEAARMAAARGVELSPHHWPELHGQLVAGAPTARVLEYVRPGTIVDYQRLLTARTVPDRGWIRPLPAPGWGFAFDEAGADG
jgi:L-alanine-DL-glutamate epimerase-like enolase superfamily enzyme